MWDLIFSGMEAFGTIIGAILIVKQISLTRESNEKNELIKRKEMTLNAYNAISDELRKHNEILKEKFNLQGHSKLSKDDMSVLLENPELMKHLYFIYDYFARLSIGVKNGIYDLDVLIDLSGRWMVRTFDRYEVYIEYTRNTYSKEIYKETEEFINRIRKYFIKKGEQNLEKS